MRDEGPGDYPPQVRTAAERRRWRLAMAIAGGLFDDAGPAAVLMAAGVIYRSKIPDRLSMTPGDGPDLNHPPATR